MQETDDLRRPLKQKLNCEFLEAHQLQKLETIFLLYLLKEQCLETEFLRETKCQKSEYTLKKGASNWKFRHCRQQQPFGL